MDLRHFVAFLCAHAVRALPSDMNGDPALSSGHLDAALHNVGVEAAVEHSDFFHDWLHDSDDAPAALSPRTPPAVAPPREASILVARTPVRQKAEDVEDQTTRDSRAVDTEAEDIIRRFNRLRKERDQLPSGSKRRSLVRPPAARPPAAHARKRPCQDRRLVLLSKTFNSLNSKTADYLDVSTRRTPRPCQRRRTHTQQAAPVRRLR